MIKLKFIGGEHMYVSGIEELNRLKSEFKIREQYEIHGLQSMIASGDTLEYIRQNFTGIPMHNWRTEVTWYGDDAKFILKNLLNYTI